MSDWISVEDRMPDNLDRVITYRACSGSVFPAVYIVDTFKAFCVSGFMELGGEVTHWMPLPDAPESEKE